MKVKEEKTSAFLGWHKTKYFVCTYLHTHNQNNAYSYPVRILQNFCCTLFLESAIKVNSQNLVKQGKDARTSSLLQPDLVWKGLERIPLSADWRWVLEAGWSGLPAWDRSRSHRAPTDLSMAILESGFASLVSSLARSWMLSSLVSSSEGGRSSGSWALKSAIPSSIVACSS